METLFLIVFLLVFPSVVIFRQMKSALKRSKPLLVRKPGGLESSPLVPPDILEFAERNGFQFEGRYSYGSINFVRMKQEFNGTTPTREMNIMSVHGKTIIDMMSVTNDNQSLTTTTGNSAFVLPRPPGSFLQSLTRKRTLQDVWNAHLESEQFIRKKFPQPIETVSDDYVARVTEGITKQAAHLFTVPFWYLRAPYWFYLKRFFMLNRPVQKQFRR